MFARLSGMIPVLFMAGFAGLAFWAGTLILIREETASSKVEALLCYLICAVFLSAAAIVDAVRLLRDESRDETPEEIRDETREEGA